MRILQLSDLHLDVNARAINQDPLPLLISYINEVKPDLVNISGDLSGDAKTTLNILNRLKAATGIPVYFVPGNHDTWTSGHSSWDSYNLLVNHESSIVNKPVHLKDDWTLVGLMGWYDFSFAPSTIPISDFPAIKKKTWNDALYSKWHKSDIELTNMLLDEFVETLNGLTDRQLIVSLHVVPYYDFVKVTDDINWNKVNAFIGSRLIGETLDKYENIKYVSFGHTHFRYGKVEFGNKQIICNPFGYTHEWQTDNFEEELRRNGTIIEI